MLYPHFDKSITSLIMSGGDLKRDSLIAKVTTLAQSNSQTGDIRPGTLRTGQSDHHQQH